MTTREMIKVMEAYERGEDVQYKSKIFNDNMFVDITTDPIWNWAKNNYRIKPKEAKMITLYEYMVFGVFANSWVIGNILYRTDDEAQQDFKGYKIQKTGREFQVEEY